MLTEQFFFYRTDTIERSCSVSTLTAISHFKHPVLNTHLHNQMLLDYHHGKEIEDSRYQSISITEKDLRTQLNHPLRVSVYNPFTVFIIFISKGERFFTVFVCKLLFYADELPKVTN
jgi:hypothetical protein